MQAKTDLTFEQALARLEQIVKSLESGDLPLDKSLALYEEGVSLTAYCTMLLDTAEKRIEVVSGSREGEPVLEQFETKENGKS